jgi:hypothetical protein
MMCSLLLSKYKIDNRTLRVILAMATSDIKANRLRFNKRTSLADALKIVELCWQAYERAGEAV